MSVYYDPEVLTNQMLYGVATNWIIGRVKQSKLVPWVNTHSYWLTRGLTILGALVGAIGIEHTYSYTQDGVFTLTLTGLTFMGIYEHGKQFLVAYIAQQIPYHAQKARDMAKNGISTSTPEDA